MGADARKGRQNATARFKRRLVASRARKMGADARKGRRNATARFKRRLVSSGARKMGTDAREGRRNATKRFECRKARRASCSWVFVGVGDRNAAKDSGKTQNGLSQRIGYGNMQRMFSEM